jgi:hypothetical protein
MSRTPSPLSFAHIAHAFPGSQIHKFSGAGQEVLCGEPPADGHGLAITAGAFEMPDRLPSI